VKACLNQLAKRAGERRHVARLPHERAVAALGQDGRLREDLPADENDGDRARAMEAAERPNELVAVHARHGKVGQHGIEIVGRELQGLIAVACKGNQKTLEGESVFEQLQGVEVVVYNQDVWGVHDS
jgi:hypothetical protein